MKNIAIVFGGKSCESDISVITAFSVFHAIQNKYRVFMVYRKNGTFYCGKGTENFEKIKRFREKRGEEITFLKGYIRFAKPWKKKIKIDCAVMCAHGGEGENGVLSALFESAEIAYTCCYPFQNALCLDKILCKNRIENLVPVLPYKTYRAGNRTEKAEKLGYPVIIKPATLGSSIGITRAENREELEEGISMALRFDNRLLIEKALIDFKEYTCAAVRIGGKVTVSDIEEVITPNSLYGFREKYDTQTQAKRIFPAEGERNVTDKIYRYTRYLYAVLELRGVVRVDFLCKGGEVYVNEINTVPGSLAWYLFKNKGFTLSSLVDRMIEESIKDKKNRDALVCEFPSSILEQMSEADLSLPKTEGEK